MKKLLALPLAFAALCAVPDSAQAVSGTVTATTACVQGHVALTVVATLPASSAYVRYTASNVGVFDLGPSISAGVWSVWVTRRSGRTAESWNLTASYSAKDCAL